MSVKTRRIAPVSNKQEGENKAEAKSTNRRNATPKKAKVEKEVAEPKEVEGIKKDDVHTAEELPKLPPQLLNKIYSQNERVQELSQRSLELDVEQLNVEEKQKQYEKVKKEYEGDLKAHLKGADRLSQEIVRTCGGTIEILDDEGHYRVVEQLQQR